MANSVGKVYLVGAGPGDPELLSLKAVRCLQKADVVLYDGLVNPAVLAHTRAECERTSRISDGDGKRLNQVEINDHLVALCLSGKTVVRLKGGDPYIFGRGSEEAARLSEAGIPFEVVPGVTAATGAGAYAGFSLTHRDHASAVAFVTGHEDPKKSGTALDYPALARFPGTLVFYMGLHRLPTIVESLIAAGKSASTPAAVISQASRPTQRSVVATLAELPDAVSEAALVPPSLIVVGECVSLRDEINWFETLPLFGLSIGITRPIQHANEAIAAVASLGGEPVLMPTIDIAISGDCADFQLAIKHLDRFDVIAFTSQFGVQSFMNQLQASERDVRALAGIQLACIGESTAARLGDWSLAADLIASESEATAFAREIVDKIAPRHVFWPKSNRGRDALPTTLQEHGVAVTEAVAYENRDVTTWPEDIAQRLAEHRLDWITLTSPSIARQTAQLLESSLGIDERRPRIAAISPLTADAACEAGLVVDAVAESTAFDALLIAISKADTSPSTQ